MARMPRSTSCRDGPRTISAAWRRIRAGWRIWSGVATCCRICGASTVRRSTDVIATRDAAQAELDLLDTAELDLRGITATDPRRGRATRSRGRGADHGARNGGGTPVAREVTRLLPRLGLAGGEFSVALAPEPVPGPDGAELITFMVRLNRGMEPRPLARVASGGELSRLMLALKVVLARQDAVPTLVFDEVDQGSAARSVREWERRWRGLRSVIRCWSSPTCRRSPRARIAISRIAKATRGGIATSDVSVLHGEDRVLELARMLGDPDGDAARRMALALLNARVSA